jgi:tetratricopeptide (TPR) repeat protein
MIDALEPPDNHHLNAAEGWLGLGSVPDAEQELEKLSPSARTHPDVLRVRYHLYERARKWEPAAETAQALCQIVPETPFGWIHLAYALHELRRTREAYNVLVPVVDRFAEEYVIRYNLACYSCQMGQLEEARSWLKKAISLAGPESLLDLDGALNGIDGAGELDQHAVAGDLENPALVPGDQGF